MSHTARFWIYHGGVERWDGYHIHGYDQHGYPRGHAGGWVKLSLVNGESVEIVSGGPHDEGYSWTYRTYSYANGVVTCDSYTNGRDCDGPLESWSQSEADINSRADLEWDMGETPDRVLDFQRVSSRQRDHYAEAMGY